MFLSCFSTFKKYLSFEEKHISSSFFSLIFGSSQNKFMWFICFTVFRAYEYCFHVYIWTIIWESRFLFFVWLKIHCFIIESISCFRPFSIFLHKSKQIVSDSVVILSLLSLTCTSSIKMTQSSSCKVVWWLYYADIKDIAFAWFSF